jgi:hypothetical protein
VGDSTLLEHPNQLLCRRGRGGSRVRHESFLLVVARDGWSAARSTQRRPAAVEG